MHTEHVPVQNPFMHYFDQTENIAFEFLLQTLCRKVIGNSRSILDQIALAAERINGGDERERECATAPASVPLFRQVCCCSGKCKCCCFGRCAAAPASVPLFRQVCSCSGKCAAASASVPFGNWLAGKEALLSESATSAHYMPHIICSYMFTTSAHYMLHILCSCSLPAPTICCI